MMSTTNMPGTTGTPMLHMLADEHDSDTHWRPTAMLTALRDRPIGIADGRPRLWWQVPVVPGVGGVQLAYQIQLSLAPEGFAKGVPIQTTPEIRSSQSTAVPWPFQALLPRNIAFWRVRVRIGAERGERGVWSGWSAPVRVVVGPSTPKDWDDATGIWTEGGASVRAEDPGPVQAKDGRFRVRARFDGDSAGLLFRTSVDCQDGYLWRFDVAEGLLRKRRLRNGHEHDLGVTPLPMRIVSRVGGGRESTDIVIDVCGSRAVTTLDGLCVDTTEDIAYDGASYGFKTTADESLTVRSARIETDGASTDGPVTLFQSSYEHAEETPPYGTAEHDGMRVGPNAFGLLGDVLPGDYWAMLRHEFELPDGDIVGAYLYATGRSPIGARQHVYRTWVNGDYAGQGPTRDIGRRAYETHDVTELLHPGAANVIAFQAWTQTGGRLQALLDVHYADGRVCTITTGPRWMGRPGGRWLPWAGDMNVTVNYFTAPREDIDARYEPVGWKRTGYRGSDFVPVALRGTVDGLHADDSTGIARIGRRPFSMRRLSSGRWLFDAGVERVQSVRCTLDVPERLSGAKMRLRMGEELNEDSTVRHELRSGIRYEDVWTLRGGEQSIEHWGYRCFRYLQIDTDGELDLSDAVTLLNDVVPEPEQTGSFHCDDDTLNEVWNLCAVSMAENRNDLYMDTPTRERMPYEGDLLTRGRGEVVYSRSYDLLRKSCRYLVRMPGKFTEYKFMPVQMAYEEYLETGDADALDADWPLYEREQGLRWLNGEGLLEKDRKTPLNDDIIDWPQPRQIDGFEFTRVNTVVNAWQYAALECLADAADVTGRPEDARALRHVARRMRESLRRMMFLPQTGAYRDGLGSEHTAIHATMYAASLGLVEDGDKEAVGRWLARALSRSDELPLSCNAAAWLLEALYRCGCDGEALDVMRSHGPTSWWSMMHRWGATQTMEAWSPDIKPNTTFAHPWGAGPLVAIARWVLGVRVSEPGASTITVEPHPANLRSMEGEVATVRGLVGVRMTRDDHAVTVRVRVPGNTRCLLRWPLDGTWTRSRCEAQSVEDGAPINIVPSGNGAVEMMLGPGTSALTVFRQD